MLHASQGSGCSPLPAAQTSLDSFRTLVRALVRRPEDYEPVGCLCIYMFMCLFVYVFVCDSNCAFVSLTSYVCLYVSLFIWLCLCVSMCLCVCLCRCGWCIYLCHYVSDNPCVCVCLCPHTDVERQLGWPSEGEAYRSMCTRNSPTWINGTQLSAPW